MKSSVALIIQIVVLSALLVAVLFLHYFFQSHPEHTQPSGLDFALAIGAALIFASTSAIIQKMVRRSGDMNLEPVRIAEELSLRMAGLTDISGLAHVTGEVIEQSLRAPRSAWLLLQPEDNGYRVEVVAGRGPASSAPLVLARGNPLLRQFGVDRKAVLQSAVDSETLYKDMHPAERDWLKQLDFEVYVPVMDTGLLLAILAVGPRLRRRGNYGPTELQLLQMMGGQVGAALKTARALNDVQRAGEAASRLNESLRSSMEALEKMEAARSDFLAIASHELRTPVAQMLGYADLLGSMAQEGEFEPETINEITSSIVRACGRLNEVIGQMLEMAELDVQAADLTYADTSVEQVLRLALQPFGAALRERRLALNVAGIRSVPSLQADEPRLVRAFSQLISNAIKYTPDGGRIDISTRLLPAAGDQTAQIEVVVADSGIGLDPQHYQLIFQKFYRVGSAAAHSTGATKFMGAGPGLGLPIAKGIIEKHGGRLWVESPGHDPQKCPGSKFFVVLPLKPPAFDPKALSAGARPGREGKKEVTIVPSKNPFVGLE